MFKLLKRFYELHKARPADQIGFKPAFYMKHFCTIPIATIMVLDVAWLTFCSFRTLFVSDCVLSKSLGGPEDEIELLINPRNKKFIKLEEYQPIPQLYDLYQDMREAEKEQQQRKENNGDEDDEKCD